MKDKIRKSNTSDEGLKGDKERDSRRRNVLRDIGSEFPRIDIV